MFFMIDHVHSYSDCHINDSEASKIWDNLWKDSIKNGVKLHGRYGNRGAHRMFIIIEADSLERIETWLHPCIAFGQWDIIPVIKKDTYLSDWKDFEKNNNNK